nr:hypothetical protein [Tanacetum cinerariifolium]
MGWDTIQLENAVSTISKEYLLEFASEYYIPESLHPKLPGPKEPIAEFPKGKVAVSDRRSQNERIFPTTVDWRTNAPKDNMPPAGSYSAMDVATLDTNRTPIQKQPEALLCLVGLSRSYFLGDDLYPTFLYDDNRGGALNPTKVKIETRHRAAHEVPLLTTTAGRIIDMEGPGVASGSIEPSSAVEKSPLDFANEDPPPLITEKDKTEDPVQDRSSHEIPPATTTEVGLEPDLEREVAAMTPLVNKRRRQMGNEETKVNAPPNVLRKDHHALHPTQSTHKGKSLTEMVLDAGSTFIMPATQDAPTAVKSVSDPNPSSRKTAKPVSTADVATIEARDPFIVENPETKKSDSSASMDRSPGDIYQPGWGIPNNCRLDTPDACKEVVDHIAHPGYFYVLRHLPNAEFLDQYNINLARLVAMGSQLRLRFEQEAKLLKKATAKIGRQDQRIQAREEDIKRLAGEVNSLKATKTEVYRLRGQVKNLETLLEAEADMKKAAESQNAQLTKELENLRVQFSDLQVNNKFKKMEDENVESHYAEIDTQLDAMSIYFDEELYPHMLIAIAGRRWIIGHGLRLAVIRCAKSVKLRQAFADVVSVGLVKGMSEGLEHGITHGKAGRDLSMVEAYDPEANDKFNQAVTVLKELKCPLVDELEKLKDAPMEEMTLKKALMADIIRAEKKKKCRVVYRTHEVGSAHYAKSDGVPVSVPTIAPQGPAILLVDAATQTDVAVKEDEPHPRLQRSISLPPFYNLEWK